MRQIIVNENVRYKDMNLLKGQVIWVDESFPEELTKRVLRKTPENITFKDSTVLVDKIKKDKLLDKK